MEHKIKHLEMIQSIIARLASNSFNMKGWCITLVSALLALRLNTENVCVNVVLLVPIVLFWLLDGYYLYLERSYRKYYEHVRLLDEKDINFSMKPLKDSGFDNVKTFVSSLFSVSVIWLYFIVFIIVAIIIRIV